MVGEVCNDSEVLMSRVAVRLCRKMCASLPLVRFCLVNIMHRAYKILQILMVVTTALEP